MTELTVYDGTSNCSCGQPAMYKGSKGMLYCAGCAFFAGTPASAPASRYGPEYVWQGTAGKTNGRNACRALSPNAWYCSIYKGHTGPHEAWRNGDEKLELWDDKATYYNRYGGGWASWHPPWQGGPRTLPRDECCQAEYHINWCTLEPAHPGWHEAWPSHAVAARDSNPSRAWSQDKSEVWNKP